MVCKYRLSKQQLFLKIPLFINAAESVHQKYVYDDSPLMGDETLAWIALFKSLNINRWDIFWSGVWKEFLQSDNELDVVELINAHMDPLTSASVRELNEWAGVSKVSEELLLICA